MDLAFAGVTILFFALSWGLVELFESLMEERR